MSLLKRRVMPEPPPRVWHIMPDAQKKGEAGEQLTRDEGQALAYYIACMERYLGDGCVERVAGCNCWRCACSGVL